MARRPAAIASPAAIWCIRTHDESRILSLPIVDSASSRRQDLGETPLECLTGDGTGIDQADAAIAPDKHRWWATTHGVALAHPALPVQQHRTRQLQPGGG